MGFEYLAKVENRINKIQNYYYLLNKYYGGKTLEERTFLEHSDFLSQCDGQVISRIAGTQYCGGLTKKFDCKYQCEPTSNGMRPCSKFYENGIEYYDKIITNFMNLDEDDVSLSIILANKQNNFDEELLGKLEEKAIKINENTIFKQRVYNSKLKE